MKLIFNKIEEIKHNHDKKIILFKFFNMKLKKEKKSIHKIKQIIFIRCKQYK